MTEPHTQAAPPAGFRINGRFYPWPGSFRLGDPVLLEELTGLTYESFLERLPDDDSPDDPDPVAMAGLIGVAIWHEHPTWRRDRVVRYTQQIEKEAIELVGAEFEDEPEPADPDYVEPAKAVGDGPPASPPDGQNGSETPAPPSGTETASPSEEESNQPTSGVPASATGSPA